MKARKKSLWNPPVRRTNQKKIRDPEITLRDKSVKFSLENEIWKNKVTDYKDKKRQNYKAAPVVDPWLEVRAPSTGRPRSPELAKEQITCQSLLIFYVLRCHFNNEINDFFLGPPYFLMPNFSLAFPDRIQKILLLIYNTIRI